MSDLDPLQVQDQQFLDPYLPPTTSDEKDYTDLPFVTLTYASSLDSMVSLAPGLRTALSGPETKSMTHFLRQHHDAILVGVGTAIPDDPGLNCRYPDSTFHPQPVIVDPKLRWNVKGSKLEQLARKGQGKAPWVVHVHGSDIVPDEALESIGGRRMAVTPQPPNDAKLDWQDILRRLRAEGMRHVMIEGGANVISSLLSTPRLIDSVIITIAPTWLGQGGVAVSPLPATSKDGQKINAANLQNTSWRQFGQDVVLCGHLRTGD